MLLYSFLLLILHFNFYELVSLIFILMKNDNTLICLIKFSNNNNNNPKVPILLTF